MYLFILAVLFTVVLRPWFVRSALPCTETAEQAMYPCGDKELYYTMTLIDVPEYHRVGDSCIGNSAELERDSELPWFFARKYCKRHGFDLIELTDPLVIDWVMQNVSGVHWLGAKQRGRKGFFYWVKTGRRVRKKNPAWPHYATVKKASHLCITLNNGIREDVSCLEKKAWLCQGFESDYYGSLAITILPGTGRTQFAVGEKIQVLCSSRAHGDPTQLTVTSELGTVSFVHGDNTSHPLFRSDMQIYDVTFGGPDYRFVGPRCFAFYSTQLSINANPHFNNAKFHCCSRKETCTEKSISVYWTPLEPVVTIDSQRRKQFLYVGDETHYCCTARLAYNSVMTIIVHQRDDVWARTYHYNMSVETIGELWEESDILNMSAVPGYNEWWGGNYINFTLIFMARRYIDGHTIACYSDDVLEKVINKSDRATDDLSTWKTLGTTFGPQKPTFVLNLPRADKDKNIPLFGCDIIKGFCQAQTGQAGYLRFVVILPSMNYSWYSSYPKHSILPTWIRLHTPPERQTYDADMGHTVYATIDMYVTNETVLAKFECISREGKYAFRKSVTNTFILKRGSLPPTMRAWQTYINTSYEEILFVEIDCISYVGWGDTQTWEVFDYEGKAFVWFINKNNYIRGLKQMPDWLNITIVEENFDDVCGQVIYSKLTASLEPDIEGMTFTCYSLDIWRNYSSPYTLHQLSESYNVFKGGRKFKDIRPLSLLFWISIFLAMLVVAWIIVAVTSVRTFKNSDKPYFGGEADHIKNEPKQDSISDAFSSDFGDCAETPGTEVSKQPSPRHSFNTFGSSIKGISTSTRPTKDPSEHLGKLSQYQGSVKTSSV